MLCWGVPYYNYCNNVPQSLVPNYSGRYIRFGWVIFYYSYNKEPQKNAILLKAPTASAYIRDNYPKNMYSFYPIMETLRFYYLGA